MIAVLFELCSLDARGMLNPKEKTWKRVTHKWTVKHSERNRQIVDVLAVV